MENFSARGPHQSRFHASGGELFYLNWGSSWHLWACGEIVKIRVGVHPRILSVPMLHSWIMCVIGVGFPFDFLYQLQKGSPPPKKKEERQKSTPHACAASADVGFRKQGISRRRSTAAAALDVYREPINAGHILIVFRGFTQMRGSPSPLVCPTWEWRSTSFSLLVNS